MKNKIKELTVEHRAPSQEYGIFEGNKLFAAVRYTTLRGDREKAEAMATHICNAVNVHSDLLEALKTLYRIHRQDYGKWEQTGNQEQYEAFKALEKAEGGN